MDGDDRIVVDDAIIEAIATERGHERSSFFDVVSNDDIQHFGALKELLHDATVERFRRELPLVEKASCRLATISEAEMDGDCLQGGHPDVTIVCIHILDDAWIKLEESVEKIFAVVVKVCNQQ